MKNMHQLLQRILAPKILGAWYLDLLIAIPRALAGLMLCFEFGSSKFGMPWSLREDLGFLQVAAWFPEDVAKFGLPFSLAPHLLAWLAAATEAIGGLFLVAGLLTRFWSLMVICTMLTAIFFQKWADAMEYGSSWPLLPAMGFLWIGVYNLVLGSGRFGVDYWLAKK